MKKIILFSLTILIIPQIVFAAWWNPFSWFNGWSFGHKTDNETQILENRVKELEKKLDNVSPSFSTTTTITATTTATMTTNQSTIEGDGVLKKELEVLKKALEAEKRKRESLSLQVSQNQKLVEESKTEEKKITFTLSTGVVVDEFGNIISIPQNLQNVPAENKEFTTEQISNLVSDGVVLIKTPDGHGSGFAIEGGKYILTNAHVVSGFTTVQIEQRNIRFNGLVVGRDEKVDVALISTGGKSLVSLELGNSDVWSLKIGSDLLAFGFPLFLTTDVTLTKGILSARTGGFLQTDAPIHGGNSGGPLVDVNGKVVGINTEGVVANQQKVGGVGLGFAIPINDVKAILGNLKAGAVDMSIPNIPVPGSTVNIKRSIIASIFYNPNITCAELTSIIPDQIICDLYTKNRNSYTWNILEEE